MRYPIYQVDAFTSQAFSGNPAGVCLLPEERSSEWMQSVAREMNLSETAFLLKRPDGYNLRWFTPLVEVDLCGHATLGSAYALWDSGCLQTTEQANFFTRSGLLTARLNDGWIEMNFPAKPLEPCEAPAGLTEALGVKPTFIGKNVFDYLVEVPSEAVVRSAQPDFAALKKLPARGVILTSRASTPGYDFVSRFFAPAVGVNEDPVTGSAHCCLGPYWSQCLGKNELFAAQVSARGGEMRVKIQGDRVLLSGQAVTVIAGSLQDNN